jgi:hypothetical protein
MSITHPKFHTRSQKEQEKGMIEEEMHRILIDGQYELLDYQRYFVAEALEHIVAGRFSLARDSLNDLYKDAQEFSMFATDSISVAIPNRDALLRRLRYVKGMPARESAAFRWCTTEHRPEN